MKCCILPTGCGVGGSDKAATGWWLWARASPSHPPSSSYHLHLFKLNSSRGTLDSNILCSGPISWLMIEYGHVRSTHPLCPSLQTQFPLISSQISLCNAPPHNMSHISFETLDIIVGMSYAYHHSHLFRQWTLICDTFLPHTVPSQAQLNWIASLPTAEWNSAK